MNRIAKFVSTRTTTAWILAILASIAIGVAAGEVARLAGERTRLSLLQTEADRGSLDMMSQTLSGNMMGALGLLGLVERDIKQEARGRIAPNDPDIVALLESVGTAHGANGTFLVGENGVVNSSWDSTGKPSTGLDVKFRPYFQMAKKGKESIYAAVSLATGKRALYFAAPLYGGTKADSPTVGAVVARTNLERVDKLLAGRASIALLLSPQGVVFSSSRPEWIGHLAAQPTPESIKAIRDLKQFGTMFDNKEPPVLPIAVAPGITEVDGKRHAVAHAKLQWNDPYGEWTMILLEDLTRTAPMAERVWIGVGCGLGILLLGILILQLLRGHHAQIAAAQQLRLNAEQQEALALRKSRLAEASLKLQQAMTTATLAQTFLDEANRLIGVLQGALYVVEGEGEARYLALAGGYACSSDLPAHVSFGDGLLGQCAVECRTILVETPQEGYWRVSSGLGGSLPRMVAILPILRNETLLGVAEMAALRLLDKDELGIFEDLLPLVALNLEILQRNRRTEEIAASSLATERELARMGEMERFNRLAQGREQRVLELKREVNRLAASLHRAAPYESAEIADRHGESAAIGAELAVQPAEPGGDEPLALDNLVDIDELQTLVTHFCEAVGIAAAIIDLQGKVLVSARWQRACTDFHRVNPDTCARCIESDTQLAVHLQDGQDFTLYRCKNGMTDCASPIIVEGQHLANVFIGQFHAGAPDLEFFTRQAEQFGFDREDYLAAISAAPVLDEARLPAILGFLSGFARMVASLSLQRQRADEAQQKLSQNAVIIERERLAAISLAEDAELARRALETRQSEPQP
ncbi:MAG: PocR ligand-binding domain-containing protein [Sulfuricella sp.]|nr:PocR ligand-binding domain-containing protein [Sulfuricella sp.]